MEDSLFPSGSHWGLTQLQHLRFPSQPETKPLEDLQWKQPLNQDGLKILEEMEQSFALDESEWKDRPVRGPYEDFYGHLSDMLPRLQEKHLTPKNAALRSNTHLPSSSTRQSSSPWSVGSTTTTRPLSAQKTPSKSFPSTEAPTRNIDTPQIDHQSESDEEVVPTPLAKRQREDSDSPTFPPKPFKMSSGTSIAPLSDADFRSSQTDSTFHSSEHPPSDPDDVSDGDRAESGVTFLMQSMLNRICKAHNGSNGYTFSVGHNVETLTIPICGSFPTTKPDLLVTMHRGRRTYSIVDFEVCSPS